MGIVVGFDEGRKTVLASLDGVLNESVLADLTAAIRSVVQSQTPSAIIVDLSGITSFEISNQAVRSIARTPSTASTEIERIVIAPQNHIYGVTRMFQAYADGNRPNVHVMRSLEEAYKYLASKERHKHSA